MHRFMSMLKYQNVSEDHLILGSEACHCPTTGYYGGDINVAWARAERYAHTILADLAAGSNGWVEWNLVLSEFVTTFNCNTRCFYFAKANRMV